MATRTENELEATWRALSNAAEGDGWRLILLDRMSSCTIHAGRRFPGNEEGLLVTFEGVRPPASRQLPKGRGFEVALVQPSADQAGAPTVGLIREPTGSIELFTMMAQDIIATLRKGYARTVQEQLQMFLRRVATWQEFMQRPGDQLLSAEAEVGLYGELLALEMMIGAGLEPLPAVESWQGPEDGLHDFVLGSGAIEVKSSIATSGFPAKIMSLDQLDDADHKPLFLCGQRLSIDGEGISLPELIGHLRGKLEETGALARFEVRLLHAGYLDAHADGYTRRFIHRETRLMPVDERFPRLTPGTVGPAIRRAAYELDLEAVTSTRLSVSESLTALGVI